MTERHLGGWHPSDEICGHAGGVCIDDNDVCIDDGGFCNHAGGVCGQFNVNFTTEIGGTLTAAVTKTTGTKMAA